VTVTPDFTPEPKKPIVARAMAQRLVEAYLLSVVDATAAPTASERASLEEHEAAVDALAEGLDAIPVLALAALTREAICGHRG
jgi:hypothetical protein